MRYSAENLEAAVAHLQRRDAVMRRVIRRVGTCALRPRRDRFAMLARSIVSQQISTTAARAVYERLRRECDGQLSPERLLSLSSDDLRAVGVSGQKAGYLHDLARRVAEGEAPLATMGRMSDEQVIAHLTRIRGVGLWTAQMFLIFALGRLDVMPHDDFGVRNAIRQLYQFDELPNRAACLAVAEPWRPYASVASWYCWRSLE